MRRLWHNSCCITREGGRKIMKQSSIKQSVSCSGVGLHSGKLVTLTLHPAAEDTGIVFDIHSPSGVHRVQPSPEAAVATGLATTLGVPGASVSTVEHLLAALRGLEVDNIVIEIEGGEVPIMDGSAASFVLLIRNAGIVRQSAPRRVARVARPASYEHDGKWIKARPYSGLRIEYTIDFAHPLIGVQTFDLEVTPASFMDELAKARTFGFVRDIEYLRKNGLALGGSLDNAVVLDDYSVLNEDGLRFADEFVRHKMLDFIGDMALLDLPLQGHFSIYCSGHAVNNAFLRMLTDNRSYYLEEVELLGEARCPARGREREAASPGLLHGAVPA